jgi:hypothetical protein
MEKQCAQTLISCRFEFEMIDSCDPRQQGHPAVPPDTMLLAPGCLTYGEILAELKTDKHGGCTEYADYRIANDGAFVHRAIDGKQFKVFFRSSEDDDSETPYAIQYRLA